ncbi:hypothetical protein DBR06_SOUSAS3710124, partial [Sousa chinensis]
VTDARQARCQKPDFPRLACSEPSLPAGRAHHIQVFLLDAYPQTSSCNLVFPFTLPPPKLLLSIFHFKISSPIFFFLDLHGPFVKGLSGTGNGVS